MTKIAKGAAVATVIIFVVAIWIASAFLMSKIGVGYPIGAIAKGGFVIRSALRWWRRLTPEIAHDTGDTAMRSQRFWLPVGMLAASFISGGLASVGFANKDPDIPEVIQARGFEVVDADGKVRGVFGVSRNGGVGLRLHDTDGKRRGSFSVQRNGQVGLILSNKDGYHRGVFRASPKNDTAELVLFGKGKVGMTSAGLYTIDGAVNLQLRGDGGRVLLGNTRSKAVNLTLRDKSGKTIFQAP